MIRDGEDFVLGFADESAHHINVSTSRVWSLGKPVRKVNSDRIHANTFGFYAMNGESVILIPDCSKSADMCAFLYAVRKANGDRKVVMILDNGPIHHSNAVILTAEVMDIALVFLPPYSPQLNPIELIWKTIKARISNMFLLHRDHLVAAVQELFTQESTKDSYLTSWKRTFLIDYVSKKLGS